MDDFHIKIPYHQPKMAILYNTNDYVKNWIFSILVPDAAHFVTFAN